jgi:hypothetical protein
MAFDSKLDQTGRQGCINSLTWIEHRTQHEYQPYNLFCVRPLSLCGISGLETVMEITNAVEKQPPSTTLDLCTHTRLRATNFYRLACAILGSEVALETLHLRAEKLPQVVLVLAEGTGYAVQLALRSLALRHGTSGARR